MTRKRVNSLCDDICYSRSFKKESRFFWLSFNSASLLFKKHQLEAIYKTSTNKILNYIAIKTNHTIILSYYYKIPLKGSRISVKRITKDFQIFQVLPHLRINSSNSSKRTPSFRLRESTVNKYNLAPRVEALAVVDNQCSSRLQLYKTTRKYPKIIFHNKPKPTIVSLKTTAILTALLPGTQAENRSWRWCLIWSIRLRNQKEAFSLSSSKKSLWINYYHHKLSSFSIRTINNVKYH